MSTFEKNLKSILFRSDCPTKTDIGEYELGILDAPWRDKITSHLTICPHCQAELSQMSRYMAQPAVGIETRIPAPVQETPLLEQIKLVFVNLLSQPTQPQAALPVFRGAEKSLTQVVETDEYIISLTALEDKNTTSRRNMIGDIIPITKDDEDFEQWTAYLWRSGELLASSTLGADSHFQFDQVQFADKEHDLILSGPTIEIHLQNLHIA